MFLKIKSLIDFLCRWTQPFLGFLLVISSAFLTFDFLNLKKKYPSWHHQIDLIDENIGTAFITVASINLILSVVDLFLKPSIQSLEKNLSEQKQKNEKFIEKIAYLFQGYALELSRKLQFENDDRVTLYVHDKNQKFIRFGRFSQNPEYQKPGRSEYPDCQGCISHGWRNGWCYESDMGATEQEKNKKAKVTYGFDIESYKNIKMKSRFIAAARIDDEKGNSLAVIVVESMKEKRFDEINLKNSLYQEKYFIADLIKNFGEEIPNPSTAKTRGL